MYTRIGKIIYYIIWPLLALIEPFTHRTRVIVRCGSDVLLVKGWLSDGTWQLPGGGVHWGEKRAQAAVRELYEETGITIATLNMRFVATGRMAEAPSYGYTLYSVDIAAKPQLRLQTGEIITAAWMPLSDVLANPSLRADTRILLQQFATR